MKNASIFTYLIDSIGNAIAVGILGTSKNAIFCGRGRSVEIRCLVHNSILIMDVVGAVDGAIAHVDTIEDSVLVAVERAAYTIDHDDAVDVSGIANGVVGSPSGTFKTVASSCLVRIGSGLVGVGTAITHVDCIGHKVTVAVGTAEDGQPFLTAGLPVTGGSRRRRSL